MTKYAALRAELDAIASIELADVLANDAFPPREHEATLRGKLRNYLHDETGTFGMLARDGLRAAGTYNRAEADTIARQARALLRELS